MLPENRRQMEGTVINARSHFMRQPDHSQEQSGFAAFGRRYWIELVLLICVPLYLYANLFVFPNVPFLIEGDQTFFWQYALRMLHGEQPYRDFLQFTPPGLDILYFFAFKLFGTYIWVMNAASLILGTALCWMCFYLAKQLMGRNLALLPALLFLVLVYGGTLEATHHWFSVLAALCSISMMMPARTVGRVISAGVLAGVASFFTQTTGCAAVIGLLLALLWSRSFDESRWKAVFFQQMVLLCAFGAIWFVLSIPFISSVGWKSFCYFQITFPFHHIDATRGLLFPGDRETLATGSLPQLAQRFFMYCLLLFACPLALVICLRRRLAGVLQDRDIRVAFLAIMGQLFFLEIFTRLNWIRLYAASMPAIVLFVWELELVRRRRLRRCLMIVLYCSLACLAIAQIRLRRRQLHQVAELPAGRAFLSDKDYEEYPWIMQHTRPGDYFLQTSWPNVYPPLDLRSPVFVEGLWPDQTPASPFGPPAIEQVEQKQVKYILWSPLLDTPVNGANQQGYLRAFRAYLTSHYARVHVFSNRDEIWQRQ